MNIPCAGVVQLEGDGEVAVAREGGDVTAGRVGLVEVNGLRVEDAGGLREDPEVVTVEVDRVGDAIRFVSLAGSLLLLLWWWWLVCTYPRPEESSMTSIAHSALVELVALTLAAVVLLLVLLLIVVSTEPP